MRVVRLDRGVNHDCEKEKKKFESENPRETKRGKRREGCERVRMLIETERGLKGVKE